MTRATAVMLALALPAAVVLAQQPGVLKIKVTVVDAEGHVKPVPRHALLISDNPVSAAPERVVTTIDGTAQIRLKPGNYTVESDEPLVFQGKSYEWTKTIDVAGGRETSLELTAADAEVGAPPVPSAGGAAAGGASEILIDWQDSIVTIWSPTRVGSGFVFDARGLIATNQRVIGKATDVEVQISPSMKVAARVLAADAAKDVAILWVAPAAVAQAHPMKLGYAGEGHPAVSEKDKLYAIEAPLDDRKSLTSGTVSKVTPHAVTTNVNLDERSAGVPLIDANGEVVAISTLRDDDRAIHDVAPAAIRIDDARALIADAEKKMGNTTAPAVTPLPVEPERPFEDEALSATAKARAGRLNAYMIAAEDFDVAIVTPVMLYAVRHREERTTGRGSGRPDGNPEQMMKATRAVQDFANWEDYVNDYPPVVMLRVTPKLVEGFWTTLGRAAAQTQGVSIPSIKHLKTSFGRLRLYCGETEVTPIHPFRIEQRVSEREFVYEGLYVFAPDAFAPACKTVKLTLSSEKEPDKPDTRPIDPKIVQQVWDDFAAYRAGASK